MKNLIYTCLPFFILACGSSEMNRSVCVGKASSDYLSLIYACADEGLDYETCNEKNQLENTFKEAQEACR